MQYAQSWEDVHSRSEWGQWPDEAVIRFIKGQLPRELGQSLSGLSALDLGCGAGANLRLFAEEKFRIAGIDISRSAISKARQSLDAWSPGWMPFGAVPDGAVIVGSVGNLPWPKESFDIIVDCECIYCLDEEAASNAYREAYRVAASNARLLVRTFEATCYLGSSAHQISRNFFQATDGPMAGLPPTRVSTREDLAALMAPWTVTSMQVASRTLNGGPQHISEIVAVGIKA